MGEEIGRVLITGDYVALSGELGSGKTAFAQGIARGMGVPDGYAVVSPTFTLVNEYPGRNSVLYHLDVYRLSGSSDLLDAGFDDDVSRNGVTVVEWSEKIADAVPDDAIRVTFSYVDAAKRNLVFSIEDASVFQRFEGVLLKLCGRGG
jgi:tRNA threonylcarbamoyladenosine biosynthesis protein TsaE